MRCLWSADKGHADAEGRELRLQVRAVGQAAEAGALPGADVYCMRAPRVLFELQHVHGSAFEAERRTLLRMQVAASGVMDLVLSFAKSKEEKGLKKGDGAKRSRLVGACPGRRSFTCQALLCAHRKQEAALSWRCGSSSRANTSIDLHPYAQIPETLGAAGIAKLDDANDAGTKHSRDCTLILTEGDSAKTLAVAGLSVVGRDRFGVFPLRYMTSSPSNASHGSTYDALSTMSFVRAGAPVHLCDEDLNALVCCLPAGASC